MKAAGIFIVAFLCISIENCDGFGRFADMNKRLAKLTAKSGKLGKVSDQCNRLATIMEKKLT